MRVPHQLHVPDSVGEIVLVVHFTYLPDERRHLIGWVDEYPLGIG